MKPNTSTSKAALSAKEKMPHALVSQESYLFALESAYGVIFEIDLESREVECIHGYETSDIGKLYDTRMTIDSAMSFWLTHYIVEEDRPMMQDFFALIAKPGAIAEASRPLQAEFRVTWDDNVTYTFLGVTVQLDETCVLFCLRDITQVRYRAHYVADETRLQKGAVIPAEGVFVRTFGYFDVFVNGKPVVFGSPREKELLALLIDRRGGVVSSDEAIGLLWPDETLSKRSKPRYRKLALGLKKTLASYGIEDLLVSRNGSRSTDISKFTCDYYEFLSGNDNYARSFHNAYMTGYGWAETTLGTLWVCVS